MQEVFSRSCNIFASFPGREKSLICMQILDNSGKNGDPRKTRTSGLRFRKPPLYPAELWGHTRVFCNISSREASGGRTSRGSKPI